MVSLDPVSPYPKKFQTLRELEVDRLLLPSFRLSTEREHVCVTERGCDGGQAGGGCDAAEPGRGHQPEGVAALLRPAPRRHNLRQDGGRQSPHRAVSSFCPSLEGSVARFGDYLCVGCAKLLCASG